MVHSQKVNGQRIVNELMWRWRGADVELGLTWRSDRVTCGRGRCLARDETWRRQNLQAASAMLDGGDFCATKSDVRRSIQWWLRCFDRRLEAKNLMKAMSLWRWIQPLTVAGTLEFWRRRQSNTRDDCGSVRTPGKMKNCTKHLEQWLWYHVRIMNNSLYIEMSNTIQ